MTDVLPFCKDATPYSKANWKTRRRVMRSFKMGEISGVDDPAQEGARVILHKRAPDAPACPAEAFVKASFRQVFDDSMMERRFCDAFYTAFEGKWQADEALQEALKDAYQNSEDTVRAYVEEIARMATAAAEATRGLAKSADFVHTITEAVGTAADQFRKRQKEPVMFKNRADIEAAIAKFGGDATEAKMIKAAAAILGCEDLLPATGALAKEAATDPAVAALKRENEVLKMAADHRAYFDALPTASQDAFLAKSATDRAAEVEASKSADPVVYKCKDGTEIRKSDGTLAALMAKRLDQQDAVIADLTAQTADAEYIKQAETEFPHLPRDGTVEMLKAAAAMTAEEKRKAMLESMRAANKAAGSNFKRIGGQPVNKSAGAAGDPEARLDAMAKSRKEAKPNLSYEQAYSEVLETSEGRALYAEVAGAGSAE